MEKVVSERVVSEKVVNNGGIFSPITKRFSNLSSSISGLCIAPLLFFLAIGIIVYSENFTRSSEQVGQLEVIEANEAFGQDGLMKIQGEAEVSIPAQAPQVGEVLYYDFVREEYKEVEEKRTETITEVENGEQVEKTVEKTVLVEKWVEIESGNEWAEFELGGIEIRPDNADLKANFTSERFIQDEFGDYEDYSGDVNPEIGDRRLEVDYIDTEETLIVIGDNSNNVIAAGEEFIISNQTDSELQETLESEENTLYWALKIFAFVLYFASIYAVMRPFVALADFIPFAGGIASTVAGVTAFIISLIFVILMSIFVKFWYIFVILLILIFLLIIGGLIFVVLNKKENKEVKKEE
jgi:hypothetical protein